jgi:uncharacterized protein YbjQ (UPF0145 family)
MDESMRSTTFTLDGHQIGHTPGLVRRVTVRSRSLLGMTEVLCYGTGVVAEPLDAHATEVGS